MITLAELLRRLADPDVPKSDILPYLTTTRDAEFGLEPVLLPNEHVEVEGRASADARARGAAVLGFLNHSFRTRRREIFDQRFAEGDSRPIILAEGDSWFQYPAFLEDVVDHLQTDFTILCLSAGGDVLSGMVRQAEYRTHLQSLMADGVTFRAMLFSAGGNDVVGNTLQTFLRRHDPTRDAAGHIDEAKFEAMLATVIGAYQQMIADVQSVAPGLPILIHGYAHAIPLPDQGFRVPPLDGWIGEPMRALGIPDGALQAAIVKIMIDRLYIALEQLAGGNRSGQHPTVFLVDNRPIVAGRWHDELHPTDAGFAAVANEFRRVLRQDVNIG